MNNPRRPSRDRSRRRRLGACGIQIFTNVNGRPLDDPDFLPVFQRMAEIGRPIWMHPTRGGTLRLRDGREVQVRAVVGVRLAVRDERGDGAARFRRLFRPLAGLQIITHHMGGMIPYFAGRIGPASISSARARTMRT
jgi:aminocarboxymuconate-semialdehyde decarboxylase